MKNILILISLITFGATGCKKENSCDCIKRTGSIITEVRHIDGFNKVFVDENVNVFIIQDSFFEEKVEAGENIAGLITTEVTDSTLHIHNRNRCNWTRDYNKPLNVYITMPVVRFVTADGTGKITSMNTITTPYIDLETKSTGDIEFTVNCEKVTSHMFGYGDITLHGQTQEHACSIGGEGFLYASDLQTSYSWIESFTSGICYMRASDLFTCRINKTGDVHCYGHPTTIERQLNGTGQLIIEE